jgi:hypothetical protein
MIVVFSVVVIPLSVLVTVIDRNVCAVDTEELAERYLFGKLVD